MNRLIWLPIPLLVAITLIGCGRTAEVVPSPPPAAPTVKAGPAPTAPILQGYPPIYFGLAANEELIAISDTIARVEMLGMTTSTILANPTRLFDRTGWSVNMEFRLRVHEYLKGSGPNEIVAMVTQGRFGTEAEALDWLPTLVAVPDVSWNDREAIVFMNSSWLGHPSIGEAADRFHIGGIIVGGEDAYTLSSRHSRRWLPEARQSGGANGRSVRASDKRFLLDVPTGSGVGTRSTSTSEVDLAPTIDIAEMKKLIAHVEAVASTSVMHRECIRLKYSFLRSREQLGHDIINHRTTAYAMVSGQPAGTVVHESREGYVLSPTNTGRTWFEGADKDLVEVEFSDFAHNTESSVVGELSYYRATESLVTTRPLPAGTYRYRYHAIWGQELLCGDETDSEQFIYDTHLTVTASPRPVHEAFFDPVAGARRRGRRDERRAEAGRLHGGRRERDDHGPGVGVRRRHDDAEPLRVPGGTRRRLHRARRLRVSHPVVRRRHAERRRADVERGEPAVAGRRPAHAAHPVRQRDHHAAHGHADTNAHGGAHRYTDRHADPGRDAHAYTDTHGDAYAHADPDAYINAHTYDDRASHRDPHTPRQRSHLLRHRHPMEPLRFVR